jgi:hypothetical protein
LSGSGKVTILDEYDCSVMSDRLRIAIANPRDPSLTDIMSEIHYSDGNIYFDGMYFVYENEYQIHAIGRDWYLDLVVAV